MNSSYELPKKILIIHTWGIGDMIMFTSAFQLLTAVMPHALFDFLIFQSASAEVVRECDRINKIYFKKDFKSMLDLVLFFRKKRYDCAFFTSGGTIWKKIAFLKAIKASITIAEYRALKNPFIDINVRRTNNTHRCIDNTKLAAALMKNQLPEQIPMPKIWITDKDRDEANVFIEEIGAKDRLIIGIQNGSGKKQVVKRWPLGHFKKLIHELSKLNESSYFFLFAGEDEFELVEPLHHSIPDKCTIVYNLPLGMVAALLEKCRLMIANDTGLSHLSSAVGTRTLSITGPTNPVKTSPFGQVYSSVSARLSCSPCWPKIPKKCLIDAEARKCLIDLLPQQVIEKAKQYLLDI